MACVPLAVVAAVALGANARAAQNAPAMVVMWLWRTGDFLVCMAMRPPTPSGLARRRFTEPEKRPTSGQIPAICGRVRGPARRRASAPARRACGAAAWGPAAHGRPAGAGDA